LCFFFTIDNSIETIIKTKKKNEDVIKT